MLQGYRGFSTFSPMQLPFKSYDEKDLSRYGYERERVKTIQRVTARSWISIKPSIKDNDAGEAGGDSTFMDVMHRMVMLTTDEVALSCLEGVTSPCKLK